MAERWLNENRPAACFVTCTKKIIRPQGAALPDVDTEPAGSAG